MENKLKFKPNPKLKLMERVRQFLRYHHYAYRTEQTYCGWIVQFIKFHSGQTHPVQMEKDQIDAFQVIWPPRAGYQHQCKGRH
jgi:hypothetical protein